MRTSSPILRSDTATPCSYYDFIVSCSYADSGDALFGVFVDEIKKLSFDKACFWVNFDSHLPSNLHKRGVLHNIDSAFFKYYQDHECVRFDPILDALRQKGRVVMWEDLEKADLTSPQRLFMKELRKFEFFRGISVPLFSPSGLAGGISLCRNQDGGQRISHLDLQSIVAVCWQFYSRFKDIYGLDRDKLSSALSAKERDILTWVSRGKTDEEISTILNVSEHTIGAHLRHIFQKFGVNSRVTAVVKGISQGLISL